MEGDEQGLTRALSLDPHAWPEPSFPQVNNEHSNPHCTAVRSRVLHSRTKSKNPSGSLARQLLSR